MPAILVSSQCENTEVNHQNLPPRDTSMGLLYIVLIFIVINMQKIVISQNTGGIFEPVASSPVPLLALPLELSFGAISEAGGTTPKIILAKYNLVIDTPIFIV